MLIKHYLAVAWRFVAYKGQDIAALFFRYLPLQPPVSIPLLLYTNLSRPHLLTEIIEQYWAESMGKQCQSSVSVGYDYLSMLLPHW